MLNRWKTNGGRGPPGSALITISLFRKNRGNLTIGGARVYRRPMSSIGRAAVISFKVVGEGYRNGTRVPGFGQAVLSTGGTVYIPEAEASRGLSAVLDYCESAGFDVSAARVRLEKWVRTGS